MTKTSALTDPKRLAARRTHRITRDIKNTITGVDHAGNKPLNADNFASW